MITEIVIGTVTFLGIGALLTGGWAIGFYNTVKTAHQDIKGSLANLCTEYQRRADLFMNLVKSVKSHKNFEKETMTAITKARAGDLGSTPKAQKGNLKKLDKVFGMLSATFEAYPDLKSNQHYSKLMEEVRVTEDRINVGRTEYNQLVEDYNTYIITFPNVLLKNAFKFREEEFFKTEKKNKDAPELELD